VPEEPLRDLATGIERAGLRVPAAMLLEILSPLDVISSQLARFSQPLVGGTAAEPVARALGEAAAWAELRRLLGHQD
jgi:hypothetical protein